MRIVEENLQQPSTITVDSALSSSSTNPVQNQVVKAALDTKASANNNYVSSSSLSQVAFSGSYSDLSDKPSSSSGGLVVEGAPERWDSVFYDGSSVVWLPGVLCDAQSDKSSNASSITLSLGTSITSGYYLGTLYLMDYVDKAMQIIDVAVDIDRVNQGSDAITSQVRLSSPNIPSNKFTLDLNGTLSLAVTCNYNATGGSSSGEIDFVAQFIYMY